MDYYRKHEFRYIDFMFIGLFMLLAGFMIDNKLMFWSGCVVEFASIIAYVVLEYIPFIKGEYNSRHKINRKG